MIVTGRQVVHFNVQVSISYAILEVPALVGSDNHGARHRLARFPRLRELREALGWEVTDLVGKLANSKPSISSIYRLEQGRSIRAVNVRRIFSVINSAHGSTLKFGDEIIEEVAI